MERPWRGALLFPSRGWRGILVSLPSLSGPKRGCIWVSLGGAGPARDQRGKGGKGVAMAAFFRFLAFLRFAPSSFSPRSRLARADAPASLGSRRGWGESRSFLSGRPPLHALRTMQRPPHPQHAHTFPIPQGTLRGRAAGSSAPGKEQWNSSRPPRVPGLPSFPVINGGATSQLLLKMLHPRAQACLSWPCGGPDQDR